MCKRSTALEAASTDPEGLLEETPATRSPPWPCLLLVQLVQLVRASDRRDQADRPGESVASHRRRTPSS